jgi:30S ribosomal protein S31
LQSNHSFKTIIKMGRGDKKTAKGKRFMGSFGVSRPHKTATTAPKAGLQLLQRKQLKQKLKGV